MTFDIDKVKVDLLTAYANEGSVDISSWTSRFPEYRDELLDFWLWARGEVHDLSAPSPEGFAATRHAANDVLDRACLASSLGLEWLTPLVSEQSAPGIAQRMRSLRGQPVSTPPRGRRAFRRAVVCGWVVHELSETRDGVSRLALQKTTYFLEHALGLQLFDEHQKKPLGPYDHTARYKDAEPIAIKKGWIKAAGSSLHPGLKTDDLVRYADHYLRSRELATMLTRILGRLNDDQLETWATVHWIARDLTVAERGADSRVVSTTVRLALRTDTQWSPKLRKAHFGVNQIIESITAMRILGLWPETV